MADDLVLILDEAVTRARAAGLDAAGWTLQSNGDGYVAWLYTEDDEGQSFLFDEVDVMPTALDAARSCMSRLDSLATSAVD